MSVFCQWDARSAIFVILLWLSTECPGYTKPTQNSTQSESGSGLHYKAVDDFALLRVFFSLDNKYQKHKQVSKYSLTE